MTENDQVDEQLIADIDEARPQRSKPIAAIAHDEEDILEAEAGVAEAAAALDAARLYYNELCARQRAARDRSAKALLNWLNGQRLSAAQNVRQFVATEQAARAAAAGEFADGTNRSGPTPIERSAFGRHPRPADEGHGNWRRGGKTLAELARDNAKAGLKPFPVKTR